MKSFTPVPGFPEINGETTLQRAIRLKKWQIAQEQESQPEEVVGWDKYKDAIPDMGDETPEVQIKREIVQDKQQFIDSLNILDVWVKLGGKPPTKRASGQTNGIQVFCINPQHNNTNTEAVQVNTVDNTWVCHGMCETGGNIVGAVALSHGDTNTGRGKLRGADYAKYEQELLELYGWESVKSSNGKTTMLPPDEYVEAKKEEPKVERPLASVSSIHEDDEETEEHRDSLPPQHDITLFDWRAHVPEGTFLRSYMEAGSLDDCVELFHLGYAFALLSVAVGRNVEIEDQYHVYSNVYVIMYGDTGAGKTKASIAMKYVMSDVLPFDKTEEPQVGARFVKNPSSGSGVVTAFRRSMKNPLTKVVDVRGDVKAVVEYGELEELTSRMARDTTGLRTTIQDLYHVPTQIGTTSKGDGEDGYYAEMPFGSLISTVQPDNTANLVNDKDMVSGTINRFLFFAGEYKERIVIGKPLLHNFDESKEKLAEIRDWALGTHRYLEYTAEAALLFIKWNKSVIEPDRIANGKSLLGRADLQMKKIALLSAINNMHEYVEKSDVEFAMAMWPWILDCYKLFAGRVGMTAKTELEEHIVYLINLWAKKNNDEEMPVGQLRQRLNNNGRIVSRDDMIKALETLEKLGELKRCAPGLDKDGKKILGPGRKTEKWYIA